MRNDRMLMGFAFFLLVAAGMFIFADRLTHAQATDPDAAISKKLDDILKNQKMILEGVESLKSELNIVKIRVTQRQ